MVVSGDRDVYQLVGDGVRVMTTSRGVTDTKIYDRDGVVERYGVPPELVTDLIGLKGDTSDNIPGVPGIGDKTAAQLLQQFGVARGGARQRRRDLGREAQAEPDRARRRRPHLEAARDDGRRHRRAARRSPRRCASSPDRSALREWQREFELRAVIQRLDDEWDEVVPGRMVEETIEVEASGGHARTTSPRARSALAIVGGRWAGSRRRARGRRRAPRPRRARRRARAASRSSATTSRRWAAAAATACSPPPPARASSSTSPTTRWSPPTCSTRRGAPTTSTSSPPTRGSPRRPRWRRGRPSQLSLGEEGEAAGDPADEARLVGELADAPARADRASSGSSAC